jgi:hypothetical protein
MLMLRIQNVFTECRKLEYILLKHTQNIYQNFPRLPSKSQQMVKTQYHIDRFLDNKIAIKLRKGAERQSNPLPTTSGNNNF